jgi:TPR repeat protein
MYAKGQGVKQDYFKAAEWFGEACDNGYVMGCDRYKLAKSYLR